VLNSDIFPGLIPTTWGDTNYVPVLPALVVNAGNVHRQKTFFFSRTGIIRKILSEMYFFKFK
jgi:hypothetical protein